MSLDGLIEGPNGEYDWCFTDQDYGMADFLKGVDAIYYGRKSYELMVRIGEAFPFGDIPGFVFSNSLTSIEKGYQLVTADMESWVTAQKQLPGKDIWLFGGAELTSSMLKSNLVDELLLAVHPIVLGEGKPMFSGLPGRVKLRLIGSKAYDSGLVSLRYAIE